MSAEIYWLTITATMTSLLWVPYLIDRTIVRGLMGVFGNPQPDDAPQSIWAQRAMAAHRNATGNLVLFAIAAFTLQLTSTGNDMTATAAFIFFCARLVHFVLQTMGIPVLRTLAFLVGWICFLFMALTSVSMI
ncbi:MAG: hypothetical protein COC23_00990 [Hyphomicrobiales bacterium]|nr:MAG: hypothetical protein COC23_00990 [Hyphomicrobiales bacterium]